MFKETATHLPGAAHQAIIKAIRPAVRQAAAQVLFQEAGLPALEAAAVHQAEDLPPAVAADNSLMISIFFHNQNPCFPETESMDSNPHHHDKYKT